MSAQPRPPTSRACCAQALAPVEPPARPGERLEATLTTLTELAADELEALGAVGAMRDPRNWVRPAAAVGVGTRRRRRAVVLRVRGRRAQAQAAAPHPVDFADRAADDRRRGSSAAVRRATSTRTAAGAPADVDGHLLPPSRPRDRRLVLELRAADLPGLHDADAGRHALPGVRAQKTKVKHDPRRWPQRAARHATR